MDYSSAFITIVPQKLFDKLRYLGVDTSLCYWVLDFLLRRPQAVRMSNNQVSDTIILNTGAPQGCVLSPLLYSLFTNDCVSHHKSVQLIKFADDTTLSGCIHDSDESEYFRGVADLVSWCDDNDLQLNASKTMEMVIDFRRKKKTPLAPLTIKGEPIQRVDSFKFLGTVMSSKLRWQDNVDGIVKRAQQRLYFLRQLKKFGLRRELLRQFYRAAVESVLTFSITVWYGGADVKQKMRLDRLVNSASRIVGDELPSLSSIYADRLNTRARKIMQDPAHPAHHLFQLMPSGKRYRSIKGKKRRFRDSFFPRAVTALSKL